MSAALGFAGIASVPTFLVGALILHEVRAYRRHRELTSRPEREGKLA